MARIARRDLLKAGVGLLAGAGLDPGPAGAAPARADSAEAGAFPAHGGTRNGQDPEGAAAAALAARVRSASPISPVERAERLQRLRSAMGAAGLRAVLVESGSSLLYFTGIRWSRSERTTAAILPLEGEPIIVTPVFEEPSVRETLAVPADVRAWNEDESPFRRLAEGLRERRAASGKVGVEGTTRSFIIDGVRAADPGLDLVPAADVVEGCRMIKSAHEIALMQLANDVTLAALRETRAGVSPGMTAADVAAAMDAATVRRGGAPEFALVLLNEASAFPHGPALPQTVRPGSVILMDCGCAVRGYQSDISRTFVYGEAPPRFAEIWRTVRRGQEIALETARPGVLGGQIDEAVRRFYEAKGWGPGYRLPGLSHRTGHGIGLDGHEPPYLVRGETRALRPGMCFSDEPGLYIPGSFGVRLEDCWRMTEEGPQLFTPLARSPDDPI